MIPYGRQDISGDDINAVVEVLGSNFLTQGPQVPLFEGVVARYVGANYAVAVNSATSALHIACLALDLGPGDYAWTSPITFVASANCVLYCGANIDFVDIDPKTFNLCPRALEEKLITASKINRLPKIVIAVHMCGQSCEMEAIHMLSKKFGFKVIEDASHAIGGRYKSWPIGCGRYSDITVFSFHPVKIITTAEGGIALTNNLMLANKMTLLRSHGIRREFDSDFNQRHGSWYYEQIDLGFNYRMTEMQAALGISQLKRLDCYVQARHKLASIYSNSLSKFHLTIPWEHPDCYSAFHLYVVLVQNDAKLNRLELFEALKKLGIGVNVHYIPVHRHPYYQNLGFKIGYLPYAETYYERAISLPLYPNLTSSQQGYIVESIQKLIH